MPTPGGSTDGARPLRWMVGLAAFVVVVAGLKAAVGIVVPFLLALFVAIICAPLLYLLQAYRVPRPLALLLVVVGVVLLFGVVSAGIGTSLNEFTRKLPSYEPQLRALLAQATEQLNEVGLVGAQDEILKLVDTRRALGLIGGLLSGLGNALTNLFFILLTVIFILLEASSFQRKLAAISSDPETSIDRFELVLDRVRQYLGLKTITSLATGAIIAAGLAMLGVEFALLWGTLAFLLNFVPNIGSIIAAVPGILQALVQLGPGPALAATVLYMAVNITIGSGIEPRVMGQSIGVSPLVVFASLVFWGWVLGPVGMLLSVPLTMTAKVALESDPTTRWMAVLLGSAEGAAQTLEAGGAAAGPAHSAPATPAASTSAPAESPGRVHSA